MISTLGNIHEDHYFYEFLKHHAFDNLTVAQDQIYKNSIDNNLIQIDSLLELAVSRQSGLARTNRKGMDLVDGSDCKKVTSVMRMNDKKRGHWTNSYSVSNILNKKVGLRIMGLNRVITNNINQGQSVHFDFFAIPYEAYQNIESNRLEIILDKITNVYKEEDLPLLQGYKNNRWEIYRLNTFKELAQYRF